MNFHLCAGGHVWVLVPDFLQASHAAISRFGPLTPMFVISDAQFERPELRRILALLDMDFYAEIPVELAKQLLRRQARHQYKRPLAEVDLLAVA